MKHGNSRIWMGLGALAGCLLLTFVLGCGNKQAGGAGGGGGAPDGAMKRPPSPVRVTKVVTATIPNRITAVGNVLEYTTIQVKSQVAGELKEVHFEEGQDVQEGQILFTIDKRPFEVALQQAEANLAKAQAQLEQARAGKAKNEASAVNASAVLERNKPLFEKGMLSQEEMDASQASAKSAQASVSSDEANIKASQDAIAAAKASIDQARLQLDYCTIKSPVNGRTGSLQVHRGNLVRANDTTALVVITQIKPIYVTFTVPEKYLFDIRERSQSGDLKVIASIPDHEDKKAEGVLSFVDNKVDNTTGTIRLKATFANEDLLLWPGQFVSVLIELAVQENATAVLADAVQVGQIGKYVYLVKEDQSVEARPVETGATADNLTVIVKGLEVGDTVVIDGFLQTAPGAKVQIVEDKPKEEGKPKESGKPADEGKK